LDRLLLPLDFDLLPDELRERLTLPLLLLDERERFTDEERPDFREDRFTELSFDLLLLLDRLTDPERPEDLDERLTELPLELLPLLDRLTEPERPELLPERLTELPRVLPVLRVRFTPVDLPPLVTEELLPFLIPKDDRTLSPLFVRKPLLLRFKPLVLVRRICESLLLMLVKA